MKFDENVSILERGQAFPQYYGNAVPYGDRATFHSPFDWHWAFWRHLQWDALSRRADCLESLLMGGEL